MKLQPESKKELLRITCGTAGENQAVLTKMADYFAAVPAKGE